jgi:hypothetical protein
MLDDADTELILAGRHLVRRRRQGAIDRRPDRSSELFGGLPFRAEVLDVDGHRIPGPARDLREAAVSAQSAGPEYSPRQAERTS